MYSKKDNEKKQEERPHLRPLETERRPTSSGLWGYAGDEDARSYPVIIPVWTGFLAPCIEVGASPGTGGTLDHGERQGSGRDRRWPGGPHPSRSVRETRTEEGRVNVRRSPHADRNHNSVAAGAPPLRTQPLSTEERPASPAQSPGALRVPGRQPGSSRRGRWPSPDTR